MNAELYTWRTEADAMADAAFFACLGSPSECKDRLQCLSTEVSQPAMAHVTSFSLLSTVRISSWVLQ